MLQDYADYSAAVRPLPSVFSSSYDHHDSSSSPARSGVVALRWSLALLNPEDTAVMFREVPRLAHRGVLAAPVVGGVVEDGSAGASASGAQQDSAGSLGLTLSVVGTQGLGDVSAALSGTEPTWSVVVFDADSGLCLVAMLSYDALRSTPGTTGVPWGARLQLLQQAARSPVAGWRVTHQRSTGSGGGGSTLTSTLELDARGAVPLAWRVPLRVTSEQCRQRLMQLEGGGGGGAGGVASSSPPPAAASASSMDTLASGTIAAVTRLLIRHHHTLTHDLILTRRSLATANEHVAKLSAALPHGVGGGGTAGADAAAGGATDASRRKPHSLLNPGQKHAGSKRPRGIKIE